jgi:hypothetical protein
MSESMKAYCPQLIQSGAVSIQMRQHLYQHPNLEKTLYWTGDFQNRLLAPTPREQYGLSTLRAMSPRRRGLLVSLNHHP